jgi:phosphoribosylaminoimidazolecarboxamide formyltransferase/IMP cyclohydrolase
MSVKPIKRALLSVSDKEGLIEVLAPSLKRFGVEIYASGGTRKALLEAGFEAHSVEDITKNPEAFGGRMKTISFQIGSALLYRRDHKEDEKDAQELGIEAIDLVVCNLYPFEKAIKEKALSNDDLIEYIDIGGPTMIRAAAKNYRDVCCLIEPSQYKKFISELEKNQGCTTLDFRKACSFRAFERSASYEIAIADELSGRFSSEVDEKSRGVKELRYGENPHQRARFEKIAGEFSFDQHSGKELSYNNLLDMDAAIKCVWDLSRFKGAALSVVKHTVPCGLALSENPLRSFELAWEGDPVSAFGSIIASSRPVELSLAKEIKRKFVEVLCAPGFSKEALSYLSEKKPDLRLITFQGSPRALGDTRSACGGKLFQDSDDEAMQGGACKTKREFPEDLLECAHFSEMAGKLMKSNAIVICQKREQGALQLIGSGQGQPNRVEALTKLAFPRAKETLTRQGLRGEKAQIECLQKECVLYSDGFFPFRDSVDHCIKSGIRAIVQPGGSKRDGEVIQACDEGDAAMLITRKRHFSH